MINRRKFLVGTASVATTAAIASPTPRNTSAKQYMEKKDMELQSKELEFGFLIQAQGINPNPYIRSMMELKSNEYEIELGFALQARGIDPNPFIWRMRELQIERQKVYGRVSL